MILLIIFITLLVAGAILIIIANKKLWWEDRVGTVIASCSVGALTIGILGLTVVITCNLIQNTSIAIANKKTEYQEKYDSFIFVADMHAITVPQDPEALSFNIRNLILDSSPFKMLSYKGLLFLRVSSFFFSFSEILNKSNIITSI